MNVGDVLRESFVVVARGFVKQQEEQVETGEKRCWQVDVLDGGYFGVVATIERIGGG
jgi:hypothetical protein